MIAAMISIEDKNLDQIIEEFSSDELIILSDDLMKVAIDLTLQDEFDFSTIGSLAMGNDLLAIIPKVIAARLDKAEIYSWQFAELDMEDLIFAGYSLAELRAIKKLFADVISLLEKHARSELAREFLDDVKDQFDLNPDIYRNALQKVNEAYRIQAKHVMGQAIDVYKRISTSKFEYFLSEKNSTLEEYRKHLDNAIELLETSDELAQKFSSELVGLRKSLILVLESLNTEAIGAGFSKSKLSYIHDIVYHIRHQPEEYIFEVISRFATVTPEKVLLSYMTPEEIAVRYRTKNIKHNRVLLSFISNPIDIRDDFVLEVINTILRNLSIALNVKLRFLRTDAMCDELIAVMDEHWVFPHNHAEITIFYGEIKFALSIVETHTMNSEYLENLQEKCYRIAMIILEQPDHADPFELLDILRRYQLYAARRLFTLRISTLCLFLSSQPADVLSKIASEKIFGVCRDLIEYQYDFLKPSSIYLEAMFNLEQYRAPVLEKINAVIHYMHPERSALPAESNLLQSFQEVEEFFREEWQHLVSLKASFSQLVIDCLALKVQELDESPMLIQNWESVSKTDLQIRINTSKDRIRYFLKQHEFERQQFLKTEPYEFVENPQSL